MIVLIVQKEVEAGELASCFENQEVWMFENDIWELEQEWHKAKGANKKLKLIDFMESKGGKLVNFVEFVL